MSSPVEPPKRPNRRAQLRLFEGDDVTSIEGRALPASALEPGATDQRTIHYLGSKLRSLGPIRDAISALVHPGARVCDLFAGSGAVSVALAAQWCVTSIDIQEYSRVLCSGLLSKPPDAESVAQATQVAAERSSFRSKLQDALSPLLEYEADCLKAASGGEPEHLCTLLEQGSLITLQHGTSRRSTLLDAAKQKTLERLRKYNLASGADTVVTRYFGGVYFSWKQAIELDALLYKSYRHPAAKDYLLASTLTAASEVVNSVGKQFAQPIRLRDSTGQPKHHLVKQTLRDRYLSVPECFLNTSSRFSRLATSDRAHRTIRADFADALNDSSLEFDVVYADPPYTRDHYSRFYHVLETMARHDEPMVSMTKIRSSGQPRLSRGLYRTDRHQSPFCIKSQAPLAFDDLYRLVAARSIPLVLSYSPYNERNGHRPRLLTVEELKTIATRRFARVDVRDVGGSIHNKFNLATRNVTVGHDAEILLICIP